MAPAAGNCKGWSSGESTSLSGQADQTQLWNTADHFPLVAEPIADQPVNSDTQAYQQPITAPPLDIPLRYLAQGPSAARRHHAQSAAVYTPHADSPNRAEIDEGCIDPSLRSARVDPGQGQIVSRSKPRDSVVAQKVPIAAQHETNHGATQDLDMMDASSNAPEYSSIMGPVQSSLRSINPRNLSYPPSMPELIPGIDVRPHEQDNCDDDSRIGPSASWMATSPPPGPGSSDMQVVTSPGPSTKRARTESNAPSPEPDRVPQPKANKHQASKDVERRTAFAISFVEDCANKMKESLLQEDQARIPGLAINALPPEMRTKIATGGRKKKRVVDGEVVEEVSESKANKLLQAGVITQLVHEKYGVMAADLESVTRRRDQLEKLLKQEQSRNEQLDRQVYSLQTENILFLRTAADVHEQDDMF